VKEKELLQLHMNKLNSEILPRVDFIRLDRSCNSQDTGYAVDVLKKLHEAFVEVYGTDDLGSNHGLVCLPALMRGKSTGRLSVGLVMLNARASGDHYNTYFFTPLGVIADGFGEITPKANAYLKQHFMAYEYMCTVNIKRDHHVDFDRVPRPVADILDRVHSELNSGVELNQRNQQPLL